MDSDLYIGFLLTIVGVLLWGASYYNQISLGPVSVSEAYHYDLLTTGVLHVGVLFPLFILESYFRQLLIISEP